MSADNAIFVKRSKEGVWAVWMGFMSDPDRDCRRIPMTAKAYPTEAEALVAAGKRAATESAEYGVVLLADDPEAPERPSVPFKIMTSDVAKRLEDRDRLWCLALLKALGTVQIQAVLEQYHNLRAHETEVLGALARGLEPRFAKDEPSSSP
jgi:hypothetical protein